MIDEQVMRIVEESLEFQDTDLYREMARYGAPMYYGKYIRLMTHRRSGLTTAAVRLLETHPGSFIITANNAMKDNIYRMVHKTKLLGDVDVETLYMRDDIVPEWRVDDQWLNQRHSYKHAPLIIIDPASYVEQSRGVHKMYELRDRLFHYCDVLVELG